MCLCVCVCVGACYLLVLLAENTLGAIGISITATYWIILLGADSPLILLTVWLDTKTRSHMIIYFSIVTFRTCALVSWSTFNVDIAVLRFRSKKVYSLGQELQKAGSL